MQGGTYTGELRCALGVTAGRYDIEVNVTLWGSVQFVEAPRGLFPKWTTESETHEDFTHTAGYDSDGKGLAFNSATSESDW